jgi:SAM-dependent methyltransferase
MIAMRQIAKATFFGTIGSVKRVTAPAELRYRANGHPLRIMLGAGPHHREGWISTDIAIRHLSTVYLNIARRFPLADGSVDAYFLEHVIEHIPYDVGARMLAEIRRTLVPGGVVRIATPDLRQVTRSLAPEDKEAALYVANGNRLWNQRPRVTPLVPTGQIDNPCFTVNRMFYHWGHRFIYDEPTLAFLLTAAGFSQITRCDVGKSEHGHMRGLEMHGGAIDPTINAFETMVLEATKGRHDPHGASPSSTV